MVKDSLTLRIDHVNSSAAFKQATRHLMAMREGKCRPSPAVARIDGYVFKNSS